jgi:hypothetical protein
MSTNTIQAIVRKTTTVAATFTGVPTKAERDKLKAEGAGFKNGQWVRSVSESVICNEAEVATHFAA